MVFIIRRLDRRAEPSKEERTTFLYSLIILIVSMSIFPAITYRFAMTASVLQVFMAMRSSSLSVRSGVLVDCGMVAHFMIYTFLAKNVMAVFHG